MSCNSRIKKLICRQIIGNNGVETVLKRRRANETLNIYGEPETLGSDGKFQFDEFPVVVAPKLANYDHIKTPEGGYPDPNKEWLRFYTAADTDVQVSDKIVWPPLTDSEWVLDSIMPYFYGGSHVVTEVKCYRDGSV